MKNILFFILGLILMIGVSATTVNVMTVKPAKPTSVIVKALNSGWDAELFIEKGVKQGYQLKQMQSNGSGSGYWVVVMERY